MLLLRRVVGDSMLPALPAGRLVVALRRRSGSGRIASGDVVIVRHNNLEKIKRIHDLHDGRVFLLGDNPAGSTDSRSFGWLPERAIIARVIWPNGRRRRKMERKGRP